MITFEINKWVLVAIICLIMLLGAWIEVVIACIYSKRDNAKVDKITQLENDFHDLEEHVHTWLNSRPHQKDKEDDLK